MEIKKIVKYTGRGAARNWGVGSARALNRRAGLFCFFVRSSRSYLSFLPAFTTVSQQKPAFILLVKYLVNLDITYYMSYH